MIGEVKRKLVRIFKPPRCSNCGRRLKPAKDAVISGTKKWDGHSFACECVPKNVRIHV